MRQNAFAVVLKRTLKVLLLLIFIYAGNVFFSLMATATLTSIDDNPHYAESSFRLKALLLLSNRCCKVAEAVYPLPSSRIYTYEDMVEDINKLRNNYPHIINVRVIGSSVEAVPIYMLELGKGSRQILVVGSLHAREWINTALLMDIIDTYASDYYGSKKVEGNPISHILDTHTIYFVPLANPDGVKLQQFGLDAFPSRKKSLNTMNGKSSNFTRWKSNIRGVDLNRNWNVQWDERKSGPINNFASPEFYRGLWPESEPEVRAIADWVRSNNPRLMLDFHSSGEILFWYYYQKGTTLTRHRNIVEAMGEYTGYVVENPRTNKSANTSFTRWSVMEQNTPAVCVETGKYTSAYQDMRNFDAIISKIRYIIPVAIVNIHDFPVFVPVRSVSINAAAVDLKADESFQLKETIEPANASNRKVSWSSDNKNVATVSSKGVVKAHAPGTAVISIKTDCGNKKASSVVNVPYIFVEGMVLRDSKINMVNNTTARTEPVFYPPDASNKKIFWRSGDESVVTVDDKGTITAREVGVAVVTATTECGGFTGSLTINIPYVAPESITINNESYTLYLNGLRDRILLIETILPAETSYKDVSWSVENGDDSQPETDNTVSVNENTGLVTAKSAGEANVIVRTNDKGLTARCRITVIDDGILYGDANGDGIIDVRDAVTILRFIVGLLKENELNLQAAEVTGDNIVDVRDAIKILRHIVGL